MREAAHLARDHREAAFLLAGARRFDGRIQREKVGLKRNASMIAVMSAIFVELSLMCCVVFDDLARATALPFCATDNAMTDKIQICTVLRVFKCVMNASPFV